MNKRILLMYFTQEQKAEFLCCEQVFKTLFRKFRKSVTFEYLQLDTSHTCRNLMLAQIREKISRSDASLLYGGKDLSPEEADFLSQSMGLHSTQYQNLGTSIFFPFESKSYRVEDDTIKETRSYDIDKVKKCIRLCTNYAKAKEKTVLICTDGYGIDKYLFEEFERISSENRYLDVRHMSHSEMIWQSAGYIFQPCVVFADKSIADIVLTHTFAAQRVPSGYTLRHTDYGRIYETLSSPFFYDECHKMRLTLLAFSALTENELEMKNAAFWLRRSISSVFSKFECKNKDELADKIVIAINEPMRKRSI